MFLNNYRNGSTDWVRISKATLSYRTWYPYELIGIGPFRTFLVFILSGWVGMATTLLVMGAMTPWYIWLSVGLSAGLTTAKLTKNLPSDRSIEKLRRKGLVCQRDSYAFKRLEAHLADLNIWISDMNDKFDKEVGMVPISQYLQLVAEPAGIVDSKALKNGDKKAKAQHDELKSHIDAHAKEAAAVIRFNFDQRELARQAIEAGNQQKAKEAQEALEESLAAYSSACAELWLLTARKL